jgi:hypothetical protein
VSSSSAELQKLVRDTLMANADITALAAGVYDNVPASPFASKTAYIVLGETDGTPDDAECIYGVEANITLHVWSKAVGKVECKRLTDLVRRALHRQPLSMTDNALVSIEVEFHNVRTDPDGVSSHGIVQVRALIEEPA